METTAEQYLSTKELMALLGISRSTNYLLLDVGLPCLKVGVRVPQRLFRALGEDSGIKTGPASQACPGKFAGCFVSQR